MDVMQFFNVCQGMKTADIQDHVKRFADIVQTCDVGDQEFCLQFGFMSFGAGAGNDAGNKIHAHHLPAMLRQGDRIRAGCFTGGAGLGQVCVCQ